MAAVDVAAPRASVDWSTTAAAEKEISDGLLRFLQPVVKQCDARLESLLASQAALLKQVDAFSAEVDKFNTEQKSTLHLATYTAKLTSSRKKLKKVEMMVMQTKDRIENISRMHNQLLANEQAFRERVDAQVKAASEAAAGPEAGKSDVTEDVKKEDAPAEQTEEEAKKEAAAAAAEGGGEKAE